MENFIGLHLSQEVTDSQKTEFYQLVIGLDCLTQGYTGSDKEREWAYEKIIETFYQKISETCNISGACLGIGVANGSRINLETGVPEKSSPLEDALSEKFVNALKSKLQRHKGESRYMPLPPLMSTN